MNLITFSLYGNDPKYLNGALRNAELGKVLYPTPDWKLVFYCDDLVPGRIRKQLADQGAEVLAGPGELHNPMVWRFLPACSGEGKFMSRDCDSRFNQREADAVREWLTSGIPYHVMRDHPHHRVPIPGGMWGGPCGGMPWLKDIMLKPQWNRAGYSIDQQMLAQEVWPRIKSQCLQHDSCTAIHFEGSQPFPGPLRLGDWRFVGEVFDENEAPRPADWEMRINHMNAT